MLVFGVDPGKSGGIALIEDGKVVYAMAMPISGDEIDLSLISHVVEGFPLGNSCVYIEKVHSMPGQGVASMFSFGFSTGVIHGIFAALCVPRYLVAPQTWKSFLLKDTKKDKDAAIAYCKRSFPSESLLATERSKKPHDGIADALCIAQYGYLKHKE